MLEYIKILIKKFDPFQGFMSSYGWSSISIAAGSRSHKFRPGWLELDVGAASSRDEYILKKPYTSHRQYQKG